MAPLALVDVDEIEVENGTPAGEEEFATPRSSAEHAPSPDPSAKRNAGAAVSEKSGERFVSQIAGDNAKPLPADVTMSGAPTPEDTTVASAVDVGPEPSPPDTSVAPATVTTSTDPAAIGSSVDTVPPPPISSTLATSLPVNRSRTQHKHSDSRVLNSSSPAAGAPSNTSQSIKEDKELARLREAIDGVSGEILHKFVRKEWRRMLFSPFNEDHVSYILRACLKNSPLVVVERGMREALNFPGHRSAIAQKVLKHITVDELLRQVPEKVLDEVAAKRIDLAPVDDLVKWLADAKRLGYRHDDFLDESLEHAAPNLAGASGYSNDSMMLDAPQQAATRIPYNDTVASGYKDPLLIEQERQAEIQRQILVIKRRKQDTDRQNGVRPPPRPSPPNSSTVNPPPLTQATSGNLPEGLTCNLCGFLCPTQSGYSFHTNKRVCQRQPQGASWQWGCVNCGQKFTTKQGQNYHIMKEVCHDNSLDRGDLEDSTPEELDAARAKLGYPLSQNPPRYAIPPPARPTFSTAPRTSASQVEQPQTQPLARGGVPVQIPRPPMHTPVPPPATPQTNTNSARNQGLPALQDVDPTARVSPSQLSDAKKAEMDRQIEAEDLRYENALAAIDPQLPLEDQEKRKISLKNGNASKKSQIRKSFGVTLRMRDKDKIASRAAAIASSSTATPAGPSAVRPAYSSPQVPSHISQPSSGFSPINAPAPHKIPPPPSANYRPPQGGFGGRTRLSTQQSPNGHGPGITNPNSPSISGVGVLQTHHQHRNKRQRTSSGSETPNTPPVANWIPASSRTQTPHGPVPAGTGLSMLEVNSEDASKKYPKKVPVGAAQAKWESLQPKKTNDESNGNGKRNALDATMTDVPTAARAGSNSRQDPIEINSSSESEAVELPTGGEKPAVVVGATNGGNEEVADADKPLPSTEDTESEQTGGSRPSSSRGRTGGFMAKRSGRRT